MDPGVSRQQNEDWWHPSPVKRTLLELPKFRYLFGNTRHTSFFRNTKASLSSQNRVALLGFGDLRNAFSTAAAAVDAGCEQLQIDLVDIEIANVARGVLLDYLSTHPELNVSGNEEDALFLWGVMYCAALPPAWLRRLQSLISELLGPENGFNERFKGYFGRESDSIAVKKALQAWAEPEGVLSAAEVQKRRKRHIALWISRRRNPQRATSFTTSNEIDPKWESSLAAMAAQITTSFEAESKNETDALRKMVQEECYAYLKTGTIYPKDISSLFKTPECDWVGNPTLLEPGSLAWNVHYGAAPFLSYLPMKYSQSEGSTASKRTKTKYSKPLTECCFKEFRALASGRGRAGTRTRMRFFLGDALELCANGVLEHGVYFSVDTSNLADNLGLLNILVICQPLLLPDISAALFSSSMTWATSRAQSLEEYFEISLGINMHLTPTLLGLRLLNPPEFGRATPRSILTTHTSDTFVWQPVVPVAGGGKLPSTSSTNKLSSVIAAPLPRLRDSPELLKGLQALVAICTKTFTEDAGRCGASHGTTLTVLHILRGLSERLEGVLPSSEAENCGWEAVADHTAAICAIPQGFRKQWDALVCWCFGDLGSSNTSGEMNTPVLLKWKVEPSPDFKLDLEGRCHTAIMQSELVVFGGDMSSVMRAMASGSLQNNTSGLDSMLKKDRLDVVGFDSKTLKARCMLPPNLNFREMVAKRGGIVLSDISRMGFPLSSVPIHPLARAEITKCSVGPPVRLAASNWIAAARFAAETSSKYSHCQQIKLLKATESAEKYLYSFEIVHSEGKSAKKASIPAVSVEVSEGGKVSVWGAEVSRQAVMKLTNPTASMALAFSCAVSSNDFELHLRRKKAEGDAQKFEIIFPKASFWPGDEFLFSEVKIKVEGLPPARLNELDLGLMFSIAEGAHKMSSTAGGGRAARSLAPALGKFKGGTLFDVKESLQSIFILSLQHGNGKMIFTLFDPKTPDADEPSLVVFVHGIFKLPDGRPIAHISCLDQEVAYKLYPTEQQKMPALRRFQKMMRTVGGQVVKMSCAAGEVDLFRQIFKRNAASLVVPKWQKKLFEGAQECIATYLTPLYSDSVVDESVMDVPDPSAAIYSILEGQRGPAGAARAAHAAPSSSVDTSSSCIVCGKKNAKLCSRCKKSHFCSQECQKIAWPQHRKVCKAPGS